MKLCNLASLDPAHQARGIKGLSAASKADREIWDEFHADWERMAIFSEEKFSALAIEYAEKDKSVVEVEKKISFPGGPTEILHLGKIRRGQDFFRRTVLASYGYKCAITQNPIPEILIASHILPWSKYPEERVNPRNGLCLAAHYDRTFDRGLLTFDKVMRLVLSPVLRDYLPNEALNREFVSLEGQTLNLPTKFPPNSRFLEYHREHIFKNC